MNKCVACGAVIPEGIQVCPSCQRCVLTYNAMFKKLGYHVALDTFLDTIYEKKEGGVTIRLRIEHVPYEYEEGKSWCEPEVIKSVLTPTQGVHLTSISKGEIIAALTCINEHKRLKEQNENSTSYV